jgi:hypothetical protein
MFRDHRSSPPARDESPSVNVEIGTQYGKL